MTKKRILKIIPAIIVLCVMFCFLYPRQNISDDVFSSNMSVHYLDVGQGDSIFVQLPNNRTMLIDAGVAGLGEGIEEYINNLGYSKIDYLVATHPHADHIGSMSYIVDNMDIGSVYMPRVGANTKTYENLLNSIFDKGLKIKTAKADEYIVDENNLTIKILAPSVIYDDDLNNCSVVLKIKYGNTSFLFTGDAEKKELNTINDDISADVLKVGHHGSRTSTTKEFLCDVNPDIGVISLGKDNDYGHPHQETIELLKEFDVEIYRTDKDKTVVVNSDGSNITVNTNEASIEKD